MKGRTLTRRQVRHPDIIRDVLHSFAHETRPPDKVQVPLDRCVAPAHIRQDCRHMGYAHPYGGLGLYCTHCRNGGCKGMYLRPDWKPSGRPMVVYHDNSGAFAENTTTAIIRTDVYDTLVAISAEESPLGAIARAWLTDDWREVDATRGRRSRRTVSATREGAQKALHTEIAARLDRHYKNESRRNQ